MNFSVMTASKPVGPQCSRYALDDKTFISDTNRYLSSTPRRHVFWAPANLLLNHYSQKLHVNVNQSGMNLITLGTSNQCLSQEYVDLNLHSPSTSTHLLWCYIIKRDSSLMTLHSNRRKIGIRVSSENFKLRGLGTFLYRELFSATYKLQSKRRPMKSQEVSFGVCKHRSVLNISRYGGR